MEPWIILLAIKMAMKLIKGKPEKEQRKIIKTIETEIRETSKISGKTGQGEEYSFERYSEKRQVVREEHLLYLNILRFTEENLPDLGQTTEDHLLQLLKKLPGKSEEELAKILKEGKVVVALESGSRFAR